MALQSKVLPNSGFWTRVKRLPPDIRKLAKKQFKRFKANNDDPLLHFEKKQGKGNRWSVDIDANYRAVGIRRDPYIYWFFVGDHVEYMRMLKNKAPALPAKPAT